MYMSLCLSLFPRRRVVATKGFDLFKGPCWLNCFSANLDQFMSAYRDYMAHLADRREAQRNERIWPEILSRTGAGLDLGSCPCPCPLRVIDPGALLEGLTPGSTPCLHHYSKISLPSWSLFAVRGSKIDPGRTALWGGNRGKQPPHPLSQCVGPKGGSGEGLAEVSVPPGASCRQLSLPALQPCSPELSLGVGWPSW